PGTGPRGEHGRAQQRRNGGPAMTATRPGSTYHVAAPGTTPPAAPPAPRAPAADRRIKALRMFATSITVFTVAGHLLLGFEQSPATPLAALLVGYTLDLVLETLDARARGRAPGYSGGPRALVDHLLPTHIAGLA